MRAAAVVLLLLVQLLLAGCLDADAPAAKVRLEPSGAAVGESRDEGEFWMVWVHGEEETARGAFDAQAVCSVLFDHEVRPDARVLRLSEERYPSPPESPPAVVAFDHFDGGDCPLAYEVDFGGTGEATMGRGGDLRVEVAPDGALVLDGGTRVPPGQRAVVTYEARDDEGRKVTGRYVAENLGAWPLRAIGNR